MTSITDCCSTALGRSPYSTSSGNRRCSGEAVPVTPAALVMIFAALGLGGAASAAAQSPGGAPPGGYKIVGYYVGWAAYARSYTPANVDPAKLTHLNYAFAGVADGQLAL